MMKFLILVFLFVTPISSFAEDRLTAFQKLSLFLISGKLGTITEEDLNSLKFKVIHGGTGPLPFLLRPESQLIQVWVEGDTISDMIYLQTKASTSIEDFKRELISPSGVIRSRISDYSILHLGAP